MLGLHRNIPTGYLDGARGLAVWLVWLSHGSGRGQALAPWLDFHGIGHVGVMLFFTLSGYLLAASLACRGGVHYGAYLVRRFLRIAPLYYLVLVGVFAWDSAFGISTTRYLYVSGGAEGLLRHLLFLKGDGIFWTLATEFFFYLLLPPLALLLVRTGARGCAGVLAAAFAYGIYHAAIAVGLSELPPLKLVEIPKPSQYLDIFAVGVVFGVLSESPAAQRLYARHRGRLDAAVLVAFTLTLLLTVALVSKRFLWLEQPFYAFRNASFGFAMVFGAALLSSSLGNARLRALLDVRALRFSGVVGYGWYLLHMPVLAVVNLVPLPPALLFATSTVLVAALSAAAYLLVEEPAIRLGRRLSAALTSGAWRHLPTASVRSPH